jgi:hypothetical protein
MAGNSANFGVIAGGVKGITDQSAPIRLQRGDLTFGACHIDDRHGHWVRKMKCNTPELVWRKCRQPGSIYSTEESEKGKIWMPIQPAALMVLRYVAAMNFWTVVSLYFHEGRLDGEKLGEYTDNMKLPATMPTFAIKDLPKTPTIIVKPRRR